MELLARVDEQRLSRTFERMHQQATKELGAAGARAARWILGAEIRYAGQGNAVEISIPYRTVDRTTITRVSNAFERRYRQLYGSLVPAARPEVVTWRLTGQSRTVARTFEMAAVPDRAGVKPSGVRRMYLPSKGSFAEVPVFERYALPPGATLAAPLVVQERESTIVVARPASLTILDNLTVSIELS